MKLKYCIGLLALMVLAIMACQKELDFTSPNTLNTPSSSSSGILNLLLVQIAVLVQL